MRYEKNTDKTAKSNAVAITTIDKNDKISADFLLPFGNCECRIIDEFIEEVSILTIILCRIFIIVDKTFIEVIFS